MKKIISSFLMVVMLVNSSFAYAKISSGGLSFSSSKSKLSGGFSKDDIKRITAPKAPSIPPSTAYKPNPVIPNTPSSVSQAVPSPRPTTTYSETTRITSYGSRAANNQSSGLSPVQTMVGAAIVGGVASYVGASLAASNDHPSTTVNAAPNNVSSVVPASNAGTTSTPVSESPKVMKETIKEPESTDTNYLGWSIFVIALAVIGFMFYKLYTATRENKKQTKSNYPVNKKTDVAFEKHLVEFYKDLQAAFETCNKEVLKVLVGENFLEEIIQQANNRDTSIKTTIGYVNVINVKDYPTNRDGTYYFSVFFDGYEFEVNETGQHKNISISSLYNFKTIPGSQVVGKYNFVLMGVSALET